MISVSISDADSAGATRAFLVPSSTWLEGQGFRVQAFILFFLSFLDFLGLRVPEEFVGKGEIQYGSFSFKHDNDELKLKATCFLQG